MSVEILLLRHFVYIYQQSYQRNIYIHGTPDNVKLGVPASHGCVRMRNTDVVKLFDMVKVGDTVEIIG